MARPKASRAAPGASWTCPECRRPFGRTNQSHSCVPAGSVDDFFAGRPSVQRKIYDAISAHLRRTGPVTIDPVKVGVFFKRTRTFAEVRAKRDCVVLAMLLSRRVKNPRITRLLPLSANRAAHFVELTRVADVDREVRDWLTEAFLSSPP